MGRQVTPLYLRSIEAEIERQRKDLVRWRVFLVFLVAGFLFTLWAMP